jgi:hypothetical protein
MVLAATNNTSAAFSHHDIQNAFHSLSFGGDTQGVHGCTPPETLHLYQQGIYKYALTFFFGRSSMKDRELNLMISFHSSHHLFTVKVTALFLVFPFLMELPMSAASQLKK